MNTPLISIIIPCLNEEKYILQCLKSVLNNDYPKEKYEIIVVDGHSKDKTTDIVKQLAIDHPNIHLIYNSKQIAPIAMNLGIKIARGEIIMRMDAHSYYPENYISTLLKWKTKLKANNIGAICETSVLNETKMSLAIKKVLTHKFGVGNGLFRLGVDEPVEVDTVPFGCYDIHVFDTVGYYDERLIRNQDIELNKRLKAKNLKVFLIPYTFCRYYARETLDKIATNNYKNGLWNLLTVFYTKTINSLSLRHFIPLFFFLSLIVPLFISIFYFPFIIIAIVSFTLYLTAVTTIASKMDRTGTTFFHLLITFLVLHLSYGFGSFIGLFHIGKLLKNEIQESL